MRAVLAPKSGFICVSPSIIKARASSARVHNPMPCNVFAAISYQNMYICLCIARTLNAKRVSHRYSTCTHTHFTTRATRCASVSAAVRRRRRRPEPPQVSLSMALCAYLLRAAMSHHHQRRDRICVARVRTLKNFIGFRLFCFPASSRDLVASRMRPLLRQFLGIAPIFASARVIYIHIYIFLWGTSVSFLFNVDTFVKNERVCFPYILEHFSTRQQQRSSR